jgi:ribosomal protein S21
MPIALTRKDNESVGLFLRRFNEKVKKNKIPEKVKSWLHYDKPKGKRVRRKQALRKIQGRKRYDFLKKIGKIKSTR